MPAMRVLSLVPCVYDTSPGQRFRLEQWEAVLKKHGVTIEQHAFEDDALHSTIYQSGRSREKVRLIMRAFKRRFEVIRKVREFDAVYVFREAALLGPPIIERKIHRKNVPIVF